MEDYLNNYDSFSKIIVYDFKCGDGGIGDCIKFFLYALKLCMLHNIKLYYLINNTLLEKYLKLKHDKMYIDRSKIVESCNIKANDISNINIGINNIITPGIFYNCYNHESLTILGKEVFKFSNEIKINSVKLNVDNITNYISIHLRLGDKYLETDQEFIRCVWDTRTYDEDKLFNFITNNCDKNIIFFCDNHNYKLNIKAKFNNVIILNCNIGHTSLSNTTDAQTLDAVTEFYLMTKSKYIYSASNSGFSMLASKFNNVPIYM